MPRCFSSIRFALPLFALVAAGCADTGPLAPASPADAPSLSGTFGATLVECPTDVTRSDTATIGPLGGVLEVDGHRLVLPPFAVLLPTQFSITVPASNYVEIRVKANGHDNFQFNEVVQLTLSYARCTRSNIDRRTLSLIHI